MTDEEIKAAKYCQSHWEALVESCGNNCDKAARELINKLTKGLLDSLLEDYPSD